MNRETRSVMRFKVQEFDTVPQGQYIAIFKDVQETNHDQYGKGVMFVFEIAAGEFKGQRAVRIGKPEATTGNITGKMISGILGRPIDGGEEPDLGAYVGRPYNILIEPAQKDKTRIAQVWPYVRPQQSMPSMPTNPYEAAFVDTRGPTANVSPSSQNYTPPPGSMHTTEGDDIPF